MFPYARALCDAHYGLFSNLAAYWSRNRRQNVKG
jgi:hypothetical protein